MDTPEILYSWDAIHEIEAIKSHLGKHLRLMAHTKAFGENRTAVTVEDVRAVLVGVLSNELDAYQQTLRENPKGPIFF